MEVLVQGTRRPRDAQVDRESLEHARNDASVLATNPAKEELSDPSSPFWRDGQDVRHSSPPFCVLDDRPRTISLDTAYNQYEEG